MPEITHAVGELIRSIPAYLGFHPADSLVLLWGTPSTAAGVRADLVPQALDMAWCAVKNRQASEGVHNLVAVVVAVPARSTPTARWHPSLSNSRALECPRS